MPEVVRYDVRDRVAVLTIDNPPVNALTPEVWDAVEAAVARAEADASADAIVLMGAGATFVAGADINIFKTLKTREQSLARSARTHALLARIEDATKPLVAAIHGHALGGGLELAQACHYRVATADAVVGQPEVLLGIIPGAGGTQRLPRLCGAEFALAMCTEGTTVDAPRARTAGILDAIVENDLAEGAIAFARARAATHDIRRTRHLVIEHGARQQGLDACERLRVGFKAPNGVGAPYAAIAGIEAALTMNFDAGSIRERELFADCVVSIESKALRHLFFAEREASKIPDVPRDTPTTDIRRAAVVGAGTMGGGIAMTYANAGIAVLLKDVDEPSVQRGLATIRRNYDASVAKGRLTRDEVERRMLRISPTTSYDGFDAVDIVVEAVFEDMDLKKQTLADLGRVTHGQCVLASNTSTLDIDELAEASGRPTHVVGHHFFSPAHVMRLLEVVRGRSTSPSVLATSLKLGKRLGKVPVVVGNCFGFVANRMLALYLREAHLLLEEGASVLQIDRVLMNFGLPVGPFGMEDIAGIDVGARIRKARAATGRQWAEGPQSEIPDRLFAMGRYGQKTGSGWYTYEEGSRARVPDPLVEQLAGEAAEKRGITRRRVDDDDVVARVTTALANEGLRVLQEGYALRAGDIDVIYCLGFGFPRHRGGPMFYADTVGLATVLERVQEYRARFGSYWEPAPLLERLAVEGRRLYDE